MRIHFDIQFIETNIINKICNFYSHSHSPPIVFIGKRNTGRSWLIRDLLFHHNLSKEVNID